MATKDQKTLVKPVSALNPTTIASDTTTNGIIIDTKGFQSLTFILQSGAIAAGTATPTLEEDDVVGFGSATTVATGDLLGTIADATFADTDDDAVKWIGYRGKKRFVRLSIVTTGSTTSTVLSAVALKGNPDLAPTS